MTVRVQQHQVFQLITTAFVSFVNMMGIPSRFERNVLIAHQAAFELANPELMDSPSTLLRDFPRVVHTFLEILFIRWVIRIGFGPDFRVPLFFGGLPNDSGIVTDDSGKSPEIGHDKMEWAVTMA